MALAPLQPPCSTSSQHPRAPACHLHQEDHIFGFVLCNDWSARDIQKFEYVPLGPFGAKNFATSISPWVVMAEALTPFKCSTSAGESQTEPTPLAYLQDPSYSSYDIELTVALTPPVAAAEPTTISTSNYKYMYWTPKQQLVHHAVTGCDMQPADLLASGTISGADPTAYGSLLELCWRGTREVGPLSDGTMRKFLRDGDTVTMRGICRHDTGFKIGFGEVAGKVLPAGSIPPSVESPPCHAVLNNATLHSYWRSSCSWRVRIALAHYAVPYTYNPVNLLEGKQSAVSRMAQVPRLDWTDAGGQLHSLTQSLAIIELLHEACASDATPSLQPADVVSRAKAREIAEIINAGTQPLQNLSHIKAIQGSLSKDVIDARAIAKSCIVKGLAAVEGLVAANRDERYCVGSHVSIADCCLVPQLFNARRFDGRQSPHPDTRPTQLAHTRRALKNRRLLPPFIAHFFELSCASSRPQLLPAPPRRRDTPADAASFPLGSR